MMVESIVNLNLLVVILAGLAAFGMWIRTIKHTTSHQRQVVRDKDEEIKDWKHKFNVMNGKYHRMSNGEIVDQQVVEHVAKSENVADAIPDLLNNVANFLPKQLSFIAKNPQIQGWIKTIAKEHPEEAKEFLGKYLPKISEVVARKEKTVSRL